MNNLDNFALVSKASKVIKSCRTFDQLKNALVYLELLSGKVEDTTYLLLHEQLRNKSSELGKSIDFIK